MHLLRGNFTEGWKLYENRFKVNSHPLKDRIFLKPLLESTENLENKTILVIGEQGIGDNIQFSRYLALLKKKCYLLINGFGEGDFFWRAPLRIRSFSDQSASTTAKTSSILRTKTNCAASQNSAIRSFDW